MADDERTGQGAGASDQGSQGADLQDQGSDDLEPFDKDRALQTIRDQRKSEAALKKQASDQAKRLAELEKAIQARDQEKLSETEKLTQRLAELERQQSDAQRELTNERTRNAVYAVAQRLGAVDTDAVYRLLDTNDLELDREGRPQNVEAAVKALLKARPYLAQSNGSADGGGGGQQSRNGAGADMNSQIRRLAGRA